MRYLLAPLLLASIALGCQEPERAGTEARPSGVSGDAAPVAPVAPATSQAPLIDYACRDLDLRDACDELGRRFQRNILVEPEIHET